jgi:IS5 family transposase
MHSVEITPAKVHDTQAITGLLHVIETKVWGDRADQSQEEMIRKVSPNTQDMTNKRAARCNPPNDDDHSKIRTKSRIEHPFLAIKRIYGFYRIRYRGLAKTGWNGTFCLTPPVTPSMPFSRLLAITSDASSLG